MRQQPGRKPKAKLPVRYSLHVHIVALFLLLFAVVALMLGVVAVRSSQDLVDATVSASFSGGADLALQELHRLEETARAGAEALAAHPITETRTRDERAERLHALATILRSAPGISAAYIGWPDGEFVLLRPVAMHAGLLSAPAAAVWLVQWSGPAGSRFDFLDDSLAVVESRERVDYDFDPRTRPWFVDAAASPETVVTTPYIFFTTGEPGLTAARRSAGGAIAGVDVSLWDLSARLPTGRPTASTESAILDARGGVLAYSDIERVRTVEERLERPSAPTTRSLPPASELGSPVLAALAARADANGEGFTGTLTAGGREWQATVIPLDEHGTRFVMAAPTDELAAAPRSVRLHFLQIFGLALLLTVPLVWLGARVVARPVERFVHAVERAAKLDFASSPALRTRVSELAALDGAIGEMRASLGGFTSVFRGIVESDEAEVLLRDVLDALVPVAGGAAGAAWLADANGEAGANGGGGFRLVARRGGSAAGAAADADAQIDADALAARLAVATATDIAVVTVDAADPGRPLFGGGDGSLSVLAIPLRTAAGRVMGLLAIALPDGVEGSALPRSLLSLVRFVVRPAVLAIERRRLIAERTVARRETDLILNSVADGIHVLDASGAIMRQNPAAIAMLGWSEAEIVGRDAHGLIHHHQADGAPFPVEACPIYRTLVDGLTRRVGDELFFRKDGGSFPVEYESTPLRDEQGAIVGAVVSFRDVFERLRAQRDLRERVKELRCLYRVLQLTSNVTRPVPDICEDLVALLPASLLHEDAAVARILLDGREYRSAGWRRPLLSISAPIAGPAGEPGFVEVGYGEMRRAETDGEAPFLREEREMLDAVAAHVGRMILNRQLSARLTQSERLGAIGQLTGGVAHDFNNLLTVIMGNAELLGEATKAEPRLRVFAETIRTAAERGADLTARLLTFARRQTLTPKAVDANLLVGRIDALVRRALGEQVELEIVRAAGLWSAFVDEAQLENALLNLCFNARDAMATGGTLRIETANARLEAVDIDRPSEATPGDYVMITVSDTGIGMNADTVARAFEPFFTTKEIGKGSGLGLSMVYGFVTQSQGHVRLRSEPGRGTEVRLYLPRAETAAERPDDRPESAPSAGGGESILLVEDDELVRALASAQLRALGYRVVSAGDGNEALETIDRGAAVDLLFTDVVMPGGLSGPRLAQAARARRPDLPVLFTSGYTDDLVLDPFGADPAVDLLRKPYRREELARKLRALLDHRGS